MSLLTTIGRVLRRPRSWLIGVPVVVVLGALLGPIIYVNLIRSDPPPKLSFADTPKEIPTTTAKAEGPTTTAVLATTSSTVTATTVRRAASSTTGVTTAASPVEGAWKVGAGSLAGYRVGEYLGLERTEAVGRTSQVTGALQIRGTVVENGQWVVNMASVTSDDPRRDTAYRRSMATDTYPTSTFVLGAPIQVGTIPPDQTIVHFPVSGHLTLRGVTRPVNYELQARRRGTRIEALGVIPVKFSDYGIPNPSNGFAWTDDHGLVEFLLLFDR